MNKIITAGELKMALKGLPNNMPVVLYKGEEKGDLYSPIWGTGFLGDPCAGNVKFTLYAKMRRPLTFIDILKANGATKEELKIVQDLIEKYIEGVKENA